MKLIYPRWGYMTVGSSNFYQDFSHSIYFCVVRSSISIVPQNPDLFEGSLRENIDPVGEHQDAEIWVALEQAHLKEYVKSLPEELDSPVREGGSSLSSGQRQLLCFTRALLRKVMPPLLSILRAKSFVLVKNSCS